MSDIPDTAMVVIIISASAALALMGYVIHRILAPENFEERNPHVISVEQQEYMRDVVHRNWQPVIEHERAKQASQR